MFSRKNKDAVSTAAVADPKPIAVLPRAKAGKGKRGGVNRITRKKRGGEQAAAMMVVLDEERIPPLPGMVVEEEESTKVSESWMSRRRLRPLLILAALLLVLLTVLAALWFTQSFKQQRQAQQTVAAMQGASSYIGIGVETTDDGRNVKEVREQFAYVAPNSIDTRYLTVVKRRGMDGSQSGVDCADREITVIGSTRYQRCNSDPAPAWKQDTINFSFDSTLFQPWQRFVWCESIIEHPDTEVINGEPTHAFTCVVRNEQEANTIWETTGKGGVSGSTDAARANFIAKAKVEITVWIRDNDGYIGRFRMIKTVPMEPSGEVKQTVDYLYSEFDKVPAIQPPNEPGTGGTGTTVSTSGSGITATTGGQARTAKTGTGVIGDKTFKIEIADDVLTRTKGLSGRAFMPADAGMLFVMPSEDRWQFWMKDVSFPLDIVFLDKDYKVVDVQTMLPEIGKADAQLKRYAPAVPAKYALEINGGLAGLFGITPGMVLTVQQ